MKKNKGFSLVELIIVIAIMAVLAAALTPMLIRYINKARAQVDMENARGMANAFILGLNDADVEMNQDAIIVLIVGRKGQPFMTGATNSKGGDVFVYRDGVKQNDQQAIDNLKIGSDLYSKWKTYTGFFEWLTKYGYTEGDLWTKQKATCFVVTINGVGQVSYSVVPVERTITNAKLEEFVALHGARGCSKPNFGWTTEESVEFNW